MLKRTCFVLLVPLLTYGGIFDWFDNLSPKAKEAQSKVEKLDSIIVQGLKDFEIPGVAIGVIVDGEVVYKKGFGFRDVENQIPVDENTIFPIGSLTKAFSTFLMGTLVDEGLTSWDQRVNDLLPDFRLWDQYATANVTIRDLLTHRTGLARHEFAWYNANVSSSELLKRIRHLQPAHDLRTRYQYCNLPYFVAGLAMEVLTETPWRKLVQERILNPLNMKRTYFSVEDVQNTDNFAYPYADIKGQITKIPFRNLSLIGAGGAMNSCIADLMNWMKLNACGGVFENQTFLSPATQQELTTAQVVIPGAPETKEMPLVTYGIGWTVVPYRGYSLMSHDGVSDGFTSVAYLIPSEKAAVVVMCNRNMTAFSRYLSMEFVDRVLGIEPNNWMEQGTEAVKKNKETAKDMKPSEDKTRKIGTQTSHNLKEYVGTYENPGYGSLNIELVDGKLEVVFNGLSFGLEHWHYDTFLVESEKQPMVVSIAGTKCVFNLNSHGEIGEVTIPFEPSVDPIVFTKKIGGKLDTIAYLRKFTGIYEVYGYAVQIAVRDHKLIAMIPGQQNYELIPSAENEFIIKAVTGSSVRFVLDESQKVQEALLVYPYGCFSAKPRH